MKQEAHTAFTTALVTLLLVSVLAPYIGAVGIVSAQSADDPVIWTSGGSNTSTYFYQNGSHSTQYLSVGVEFGGGESYAIQINDSSIFMISSFGNGGDREARRYQPDGTLVWSSGAYSAGFADITGNGTSYFDSDNAGGVAKVNASGSEVYNKQIGTFGSSWTNIAIQETRDDYIALSASGGEEFGFYQADGSAVYEKSGIGRYEVLAIEPTDSQPNLFIATRDNATLMDFSGNEVWNVSRPDGGTVDDIAVTGAYTSDILYLGDTNGNLSAYETDTGNYLWTADLNPGSTNDPIDIIFGPDGEAYVGTSGGKLVNVDTDGNIDYRVDTPGSGNIAFDTELVKPAPPQPPSNLTLEVRQWMPQNSTQRYRVFQNETTDVTNSATVTSDNTSVIAVNTSTNELESFGVNDTANITAEYQGENTTVQVTVATRTLDNIGILPPPQWPCGFLGCDDGDNPHNIGSSMQWLWLIIVIMVAATRFAENPFVGVGTGIVFSILVWVLEYIDLGAVLITVFSGLLIGGLMARTQMGRGVTRDNEEAARISSGRNE